jgi:hypothetical protein
LKKSIALNTFASVTATKQLKVRGIYSQSYNPDTATTNFNSEQGTNDLKGNLVILGNLITFGIMNIAQMTQLTIETFLITVSTAFASAACICGEQCTVLYGPNMTNSIQPLTMGGGVQTTGNVRRSNQVLALFSAKYQIVGNGRNSRLPMACKAAKLYHEYTLTSLFCG